MNETKVTLVTKTKGVGPYKHLKKPGEIIEAVARHGKIKSYGKLIKYLTKHKHWSPLEHVHYTFLIETARDISAQMMRHRSFHWQELSQRYDKIQKFMPVELRKQGKTNRQVGDEVFDPSIEEWPGGMVTASELVELHLHESRKVYEALLEAGVARECARRILPMCSKTTVHMTGNLRDFMMYLNVRCEEGTQKEHREVALGIGEILEKEFPELKEFNWRKGLYT